MLNPNSCDDGKTRKKIDDAAELARDLWKQGNHIVALELTEKAISDHWNHEKCFSHHELQGDIFFDKAMKTDITNDIKCVYLFASVDAYSMATLLCPNPLRSFPGYARSLIELGDELRINKFYSKVSKAKPRIFITQPQGKSTGVCYFGKITTNLQKLIHLAAEKMQATVTVSDTATMANQKEPGKEDPSFIQLKKIWAKLDDKTKRDFLVVDFGKLIGYIEDMHGTKVKEHFQKCVPIANNLPWRCWKCHICSQVNYSFTDCKMHILDNHVHKFEPAFSARPKYVDEILANMICCGNWKPVDTAKATNLIKDRINSWKDFVYVNGWCSDWPVANDNERENILKQFAQVLKSSCPKENRTLSCTLWDWLIDYTEENLELPGVRGIYLDRWDFFKNPQCICFLGLKHLEHILKYLRQLTADDVRASLVLKVVNQLWKNYQVKERIDLEGLTTYNLLLDKRLLNEGKLDFEKNETVEHYQSTGIYDDVMPEGDKIVSWVLDCPEIDQEFVSQMAKGVHNREIWLAVLKIVRCMVRKKENYYDKRNKMLTYERMLGEAETICKREDTRNNVNQRSTYELALRIKSEEFVVKQDDTKCFLNVIRDVFERKNSPRFEVLEDMECISKFSITIPNDVVKKSLLTLRKSLKEKFLLIDSKILRNESTYKKLINVFPKLSVVEYRLVVLPFVKKFLQDKLKKMMKRKSSSVVVGDSAEREHKKRHLSKEIKDLANCVNS